MALGLEKFEELATDLNRGPGASLSLVAHCSGRSGKQTRRETEERSTNNHKLVHYVPFLVSL